MDGRTSALLLLGLSVACCGCVTTQDPKAASQPEAQAAAAAAAPHKDEPKRPAPAGVLLAFAVLKEDEADQAKDRPDVQARIRDEARQAYQEVLRHDADNIDAVRGLGRVYVRLGEYDRALETYRRALAKRPRDVNLWYDLGMLHDRRKSWAEGATCFTKALAIDPEHRPSLKALGFTLVRTGQYDQGLAHLTRAMGSSAAHYNLAMMLLHLGEQDAPRQADFGQAARHHLRLALQDDPNYAQARDMLARLEAPAGPTHGVAQIQFAEPRP